MSVMGLASAVGALQSLLSGSAPNRLQQFQQSFQQLGADLQSGNLSQAQADLNGVQSGLPVSPASTTAFHQLQQDLKMKNLSASQSDYASLQQTLSGTISPATQMQQINQALASTHASAAQRAYTALQGELAAYSPFSSGHNAGSHADSSSGVSLNTTV